MDFLGRSQLNGERMGFVDSTTHFPADNVSADPPSRAVVASSFAEPTSFHHLRYTTQYDLTEFFFVHDVK